MTKQERRELHLSNLRFEFERLDKEIREDLLHEHGEETFNYNREVKLQFYNMYENLKKIIEAQ